MKHVEKIATLPGVRVPSRTGHAIERDAPRRNVVLAYGGRLASAATPNVLSIALRAAGIAFVLLTICATTGIAASLPMRSVLDSSRSRKGAPSVLNLYALPRSIRCGKSTFHGGGGTYGQFGM